MRKAEGDEGGMPRGVPPTAGSSWLSGSTNYRSPGGCRRSGGTVRCSDSLRIVWQTKERERERERERETRLEVWTKFDRIEADGLIFSSRGNHDARNRTGVIFLRVSRVPRDAKDYVTRYRAGAVIA